MKYLWLFVLLVPIILLSGCINDGSTDGDINMPVYENGADSTISTEDTVPYNVEPTSTNTIEDNLENNTNSTEGEVYMCIMKIPPDTTQTYYFSDDSAVLLTENTNGMWIRSVITPGKICGTGKDMPTTCTTSSNTETLKAISDWKDLAQIMPNTTCSYTDYDEELFTLEVN